MSVLSKMKKFTNNPVITTGITGWDQLPVELLEIIFESLEKRNDLLSVRRVCRHWKSVVSRILEQRTLQLWTNWDPSTRNISTFPDFRYLECEEQEPSYLRKKLIQIRRPRWWIPSFKPSCVCEKYDNASFWKKWTMKGKSKQWPSLFKSKNINPFPNRSLCLFSIPIKNPHCKLKGNTFLETFGKHLTSLQIHSDFPTTITQNEMYSFLKQMPNLKALTIFDLWVRNNKKEVSNQELLPSPNPSLTHLRINQLNMGPYDDDELHFLQWLIKLFAPQLVSLKLSGTTLCPFKEGNGDNRAFQRLKQLELTHIYSKYERKNSTCFLHFPLEYLSIVPCSKIVANWAEIMRFINKFSGSLRTFHFKYHFDVMKDNEPVIIFTKMEKLVVSITRIQPSEWYYYCDYFDTVAVVVEIIKTKFAPRFRNLKTLQLLNFTFEGNQSSEDEMMAEAAEFIEMEGFWKLFPKLETIQVQPAASYNSGDLHQIRPFIFTSSNEK